eukprot:EG_transcript_12102
MRAAVAGARSFSVRAAAGQYVLPDHGRYGQVVRPARLEEFELNPHQNPSRDRDWSAEIRGFYRDLLKSIPTMKQRFRLVIPNDVVRQNIRKRFEQGPKLTDPAALRHRALMVSADLEEYFREDFLDSQVQGKYNNMDPRTLLNQEIAAAASETQTAHRFFNEGTNVLLETGIGGEDVTENRVYITREQAYRKGLASLRGDAAVRHLLPAVDPANQTTLQALAAENDLQALVDLLGHLPAAKTAEAYVQRCEAFHKEAGLRHQKASGGAVLAAWEKFKDEEVNSTVLLHPAYKALIADPSRNPLLRGAADWVRLVEAGGLSTTEPDSAADKLLKVAQHLYYSDQLPEGFAQDLGVSYLADLKGVDRRLDLLLDEEIAYRQELLLKIYAHTVESIKATASNPTDPAAVKKHLDAHDWSAFVVPTEGVKSSYEALAL